MAIAEQEQTGINKTAVLEVAQARIKLIGSIIEKGQDSKDRVYRPRMLTGSIFGQIATRWHITGYDVEGVENLQRVRGLIQDGIAVIGASNHNSDGNSLEINEALKSSGFQDLSSSAVFPAGLKMEERWYIEPFVGAVNSVPVAPPNYTKEAKILAQTPNEYDLAEDEVRMLKTYISKCDALNLASIKRLRLLTMRGGLVMCYPETTRSRTGYIQYAPDEAEVYFRFKNSWILPINVSGTSAVIPPEGVYNPLKRVRTRMVVGEPYPASLIYEQELPSVIEDRVPRRIDIPMMVIASLNTDLVRPEDLRYYRALSRYFPSIPGFSN